MTYFLKRKREFLAYERPKLSWMFCYKCIIKMVMVRRLEKRELKGMSRKTTITLGYDLLKWKKRDGFCLSKIPEVMTLHGHTMASICLLSEGWGWGVYHCHKATMLTMGNK